MEQVILFDDTTVLSTKVITVMVGFQPDEILIENVTENPDKPILKWNRTMLSTVSIAGGILQNQVGAVVGSACQAGDATGIQLYAGGEVVEYSDASVPTYRNRDTGAAVDGGTLIDKFGDVLSREMPAKTDGQFEGTLMTSPGFALPALAALRGNGEILRITARTTENGADV